MQLVEQHCISKKDARYAVIDAAAFASKNLYNAANYELRQACIFQKVCLRYEELYHRMKSHEAYRALPAKVAQQVLKVLEKNWKSYVAACLVWKEHPEKFLGHPKLPKYKDKVKGRNLLVYTIQAISKPALERGIMHPSGLAIEVQTKQTNVAQVRIIPRSGFYVVEVVYEAKEGHAEVDASLIAGIDIGLNNLATLTANKSGFVPRLVNGRPVKSINQYYNKERARLASCLPKEQYNTHRLDRLTTKRTRRINHYLHASARAIIDLLVAEGIGTLVIGKNEGWKQEITIGKRNNQNFVQIPHARFIDPLTSKLDFVHFSLTNRRPKRIAQE